MPPLLSLILLLSPLLTTSTSFTPPLIQSTCKATTNCSLCITTLDSGPNSLNANTTKDLAKVAITVSLTYAANTSSYMFTLAKNAPTVRSSALRACAQRFGYAREALQRAVEALEEEEEYDYAAVHVGAAKEYPGVCRALFRGGASTTTPGLSYPGEVSRMGKELEGLCQLALDLVSLLID